MEMRIGCNADSSLIDGDLTVLDGVLGKIREAGFTDAEIPVHGVDCIMNGNLSRERLRDTLRVLGRHALSWTVHGPDALDLADPEQPELHASAFRAAIDFTEAIGASVLVYHGCTRNGRFAETGAQQAERLDPERIRRAWREEIDRLRDAADYARRKRVTIALENIFRQGPDDGSYRIDPRELALVVDAVDSPALGICFDFGHAWISSNEEGFPLEEALRAVLPRMVHLHLHDNFGRPAREGSRTIDSMFLGAGDLHLPPGRGTIPFETLFPRFAPGYRGVYLLELQPRFADCYGEALAWVRNRGG